VDLGVARHHVHHADGDLPVDVGAGRRGEPADRDRAALRAMHDGAEDRQQQEQGRQDDRHPREHVAGPRAEGAAPGAAEGSAQPAAAPLLEQHDQDQDRSHIHPYQKTPGLLEELAHHIHRDPVDSNSHVSLTQPGGTRKYCFLHRGQRVFQYIALLAL